MDAAPTSEDPAECVADKGYHSRAVLRALNDSPWKTRIAAPKQTGFSRWHGDEAARRVVTNNRARLKSGVAREAFKLRAEIVERCFAHNLDRGGMRRTWLRGRENVHKRYLLHVAGHNLSLLMRQLHRRRHPAGGRGGRIWRYFRSAHAHRGHAGGTGGLAKRPDGFRRRIPHLGVRAGKSHLINGLLGRLNWEPLTTKGPSIGPPQQRCPSGCEPSLARERRWLGGDPRQFRGRRAGLAARALVPVHRGVGAGEHFERVGAKPATRNRRFARAVR